MRIEIKTKEPIKCPDLRAIIIMDYALSSEGTPRMLEANLTYIADKYGYLISPKLSQPLQG